MTDPELNLIKLLSARIIEAQRAIRILDSIKWDERIKDEFFRGMGRELPKIDLNYYKSYPLVFKPKEKIEEFRGIIRDSTNQLGQYTPITRLIKRVCDDYIAAVQMIAVRGTPFFSQHACELYGHPNDVFYPGGPKLSDLGFTLFDLLTDLDLQLKTTADEKRHSAKEAQELLQSRLNLFFDQDPGRILVSLSDGMVADAAAGAETIKLNQHIQFSDRELKSLEVHEGWVHMGTTLNGLMQPYCSFLSKGGPSCAVLQEGLAVLVEVISFSAYPSRMRKITNRVIAIDKIMQGANFLDIYQYFISCGLEAESSYYQTVRVFRGSTPEGGAFTKDLSYAKGFILSHQFIHCAIHQKRIEAIPLLFVGKLALDDLPLLMELKAEGILTSPIYLPPQIRDFAALSSWIGFSLFLNQFDFKEIQKQFRFLLA